jgi:hypothetical protein
MIFKLLKVCFLGLFTFILITLNAKSPDLKNEIYSGHEGKNINRDIRTIDGENNPEENSPIIKINIVYENKDILKKSSTEKRIVFLHIGKAGGTSFDSMMKAWN